MTVYVDSSALLKLHVDEADSRVAQEIIDADPVRVTAWITLVEVRRDLARLLEGPHSPACAKPANATLTQ